MQRINAAAQREKDFLAEAANAEAVYGESESYRLKGEVLDPLAEFNILHSNVETIVPAIFNSQPVPDIRRRYTTAGEEPKPPQPQQEGMPPDPMEMQKFQMELMQYQQAEAQDEAAQDLGSLLESGIEHQTDDNKLEMEVEHVAQDSFLSGRGLLWIEFNAKTEGDQISGESIDFQAISFRDFRMGKAKRWKDVPWVAVRYCIPRKDHEKEYGDDVLLSAQSKAYDGPAQSIVTDADTQKDDDIYIWNVWDKNKREVIRVRESDCRVLKKIPDPLKLSGFFPMPEPVQPIRLTGEMTPVVPYTVYRKLAQELDLATKRINAIMNGLKVRGLIAGNAQQIVRLSEADDNEIVVVEDIETLAQTGGLEKAVLWWPIEQAVAVLQQLYVQRNEIKAAIYEITGISDIVRGASNSGETATAQQIKTQWGSLRIQKMQRLIQRCVRDTFVIMTEILMKHFSPETLQLMTGQQITPEMQALMQSPNTMVSYRIDVETDSTISADLTRQKQEIAEFVQGSAQYFQAVGPMAMQVPEAAKPLMQVYGSFARLYNLGKQSEDAIDNLIKIAENMGEQAQNQQPPPDPKAEQTKLEMAQSAEKHQQDSQQSAQEHAQKMEQSAAEFAMKQADDARKQTEHQMRMQDIETNRLNTVADRFTASQDRDMKNSQEAKRFEMDTAMHNRDLSDRDAEAKAKRIEAGLEDPDVKLTEMMADGFQQLGQLVAQSSQKTSEQIAQLEKVVSAPNELVRDNNGRPVGSRKVLN